MWPPPGASRSSTAGTRRNVGRGYPQSRRWRRFHTTAGLGEKILPSSGVHGGALVADGPGRLLVVDGGRGWRLTSCGSTQGWPAGKGARRRMYPGWRGGVSAGAVIRGGALVACRSRELRWRASTVGSEDDSVQRSCTRKNSAGQPTPQPSERRRRQDRAGGTMEADLMQRLPEDVLVAVLSRLPPHVLAAARCVCKSWHAVIDAHRLLDLFPPSLAGLFINFNDLYISEFFFRPQRDTYTSVSGMLDYAPTENDDTIIVDHCNGLLLFCTYVANPATRRWAALPPPPPGPDSCHIVFDPAVSPHYEVLKIPTNPWCITGVELQHEWPPSPFSMYVFSSTTRNWEERSFVRQGGAIGTVAQLQQRLNWSMMPNQSAYWRGQLYVLSKFVMRISLSNCTYQATEPPINVGTRDQMYRLGRSENGVYFASIDLHCRLRVWILNELHGGIEWVLKHDNNLDHIVSRGRYDPQVQGPWIIEDINYNLDHSTSAVNKEEAATKEEEDTFQWDSDNENTLDTRLEDGKRYTGIISILGFHPYKEIIFLNESDRRGLAYHPNSSKLEDLGNIYPKYYTSMVEESFSYTPCWIGKLPGSS